MQSTAIGVVAAENEPLRASWQSARDFAVVFRQAAAAATKQAKSARWNRRTNMYAVKLTRQVVRVCLKLFSMACVVLLNLFD